MAEPAIKNVGGSTMMGKLIPRMGRGGELELMALFWMFPAKGLAAAQLIFGLAA